MKSYLAMIRMNLRLTMRDRTVLFFNYIFPLIFFFIFGQMMHADQGGIIVLVVTMVLSLGILASGLFGAGMRIVSDREQNILRRFKVAPISPATMLVGSLVTALVHYIPVTFLILTLAHYMYGLPPLEHPISLYAFVLIGVLAFRAIGGIVGSVANSMQESQILVQLLYFPMLFLGGATFPIGIMPKWLQQVAQFIPTTYLSTGLNAMLTANQTIADNWSSAAALLVTAFVGTFLAVKLFRWEKEEKMRGSAKLWLIAVLAPIFGMGAYQSYAKDNVVKQRILQRAIDRDQTYLIRDARLFLGDGTVIDPGSVLVKHGKIAEIFTGPAPDAKALKAEAIDAAGKTLLPGLIDVHAHLGSTGGFYEDPKDYETDPIDRELAAYLYSGVTAVKSLGDATDSILKHRAEMRSAEKLGAELYVVGPMFTAPGGHGTEYARFLPKSMQEQFEAQTVRLPKTAEEARQMVDDLNKLGVDGIKVILEPGAPGHPIPRFDSTLLRAVSEEAHKDSLPVVCHVGDLRDVEDALDAKVDGIEHSPRAPLTDALLARMKSQGVAFDPTLAVVEAIEDSAQGKTDPLDHSLVEQVAPPRLLESTRKLIASPQFADFRAGFAAYGFDLKVAEQNLAAAAHAGVMLTVGTDSGNPQLIHGPAIHRELQLWVEAGLSPAAALEAATYTNARLLRIDSHEGLIRKGYDANLLLVDGNPLKDISSTEHIAGVFFKGEHINRSELFDQP
ncbi:MAG TPA: amidohydrolase family protein [Bryobacteraceae bacterium]|nr:amidohydrolase family protein [Bryobacteraceae bacterium]